MDWIITIPKTIDWQDYLKEIEAVKNNGLVMNYKVRGFPKEMKIGDKCHITHNGFVKGFMVITGLAEDLSAFLCTTTGVPWSHGKYIQRGGKFYFEDRVIPYKGFRGVRRFE